MKTISYLLILACSILLSACAGMGESRPQASEIDANALASGARIASAGKAATQQWPQAQWWRSYGDPQLDELIAAALNDSPDLHMAEARVRQARAYAGLAESATRPSLSANAAATRELFSANDFIPPPEAGNYAWYNHASLDATYDLDLWGGQRQALTAALDEVKVAGAESQMARLALENDIVRGYVQFSLQFALKDLAQDTLMHKEKALQVVRRRVAAGLATDMEVTQLEAAIPPLHIEIEHYDKAIAVLRNQLAALSGKGPAAGERLNRPTLALGNNAWLRLPSALPADLIGHRPDVAARRWGVEAAARQIDVAKAAFYPNINLMAFIGFQSVGFSQFLDSSSAIRGVGPAVSLPIFDGGRLRSNLGARTAAYDIAVENYNGTLVHALESVANTLVVAQSLQHEKSMNDAALATATRARALAGKSFAAGMTDFLVLLNSEVTLLAQQQQQAEISARMLESHAALMLALGGGYLPSDDTDTSTHPDNATINKVEHP